MTAFACFRPSLLARFAFALLAAWTLTSCGSGAVGPVVVDPSRITILPGTATLYSGLPTTFTISGGTGSYIVSSSNQAIVQVSGLIPGHSLIIAPNPVLADTTVTLTVRDTGTAPLVTATLTVRPGTVNNNITVTPSGTQGGGCAPAVCSGGDALVTATLSQGGIPLAARGARLEVISGDFRFIVSSVGAAAEVLATSVDVVSDEQGRVSARIRVLADAPNQTALLQVTDLGTGAFQRASFLILQATGTSPGFFVTPTAIAFSGPRVGTCANIISATFFIFGGSPPYTVLNTAGDAFFVSTDFVSASGGGVGVTARGVCVGTPGLPIVVRDTSGRTASVLVSNVEGTTVVEDVVVAPDEVTIADCSASSSVTIAGGTGSYFVATGSSALSLVLSANTLTIRRRSNSGATSTPILVGVSDGRTTATVTVNLTGEGAGACPAPPTPPIVANPSGATLTNCTPPALAQVITLSGGTGTYTAVPSVSNITTNIVGPNLSISRTSGTGLFISGTVTVTSGSATLLINVTGFGLGAGAC